MKEVLLVVGCFVFIGCQQKKSTVENIYSHIDPEYNFVQLQETSDSLHIFLDDSTFSSIKSFNIFYKDGNDYFSFHDGHSQTVNIFDLLSGALLKKIRLKEVLKNPRFLKTAVFCKNFDSILVSNLASFYIIDTSGTIKDSIVVPVKSDYNLAVFGNQNPPVIKNGLLYTGARASLGHSSFKALRNWRILYEFDLVKKRTALRYPLPEFYQENIYGENFLKYNYCYNDKGNFVFSFWADTLIYETNLIDCYKSYFAKSRFQSDLIQPPSKKDLENNGDSKDYTLKDSYGAIYFDPYAKRYLRVAKSRVTPADYEAKRRTKRQRVIIFDQHFKIIGESPISERVSLDQLFFTKNGDIYARTKIKDEYSIHFVRLAYAKGQSQSK
jgi:hypothetical protein